jgi:hypothetical protein
VLDSTSVAESVCTAVIVIAARGRMQLLESRD